MYNQKGEIMDKKIRQLRSESHTLKAHIVIGKNGPTDQTITNIKTLLKKQPLVKIKILPAFLEEKDKKAVFTEIATKSGGKVIDIIGFTMTLGK